MYISKKIFWIFTLSIAVLIAFFILYASIQSDGLSIFNKNKSKKIGKFDRAVSLQKATDTITDGNQNSTMRSVNLALNQQENELLPVKINIIMYHALSEDVSRSGKYVISPKTLKNDLEWLKLNNYTSISVKQLYNQLVSPQNDFPKKCVIISFDDGYYNFYTYAYPLLCEYDCKFVLSLIVSQTQFYSMKENEKQNIAYSHVNFTQVKELLDSGLCEIGNHTYDLHSTSVRNGITPKRGESINDYKANVGSDILKAQELIYEHTSYTPYIFAYPFGAYNDTAGELIKSFPFIAGLSCEEGTNVIYDTSELLLLKRYNRPDGITSEEFFNNVMEN